MNELRFHRWTRMMLNHEGTDEYDTVAGEHLRNCAILTIAGSDPSGGAGIQADLRVFATLGLAGLSAITALTVQNSQGVHSVHFTPPEILEAQLAALFEDSDISAVKIGLAGEAEHIEVIANVIKRYKPAAVVLDPVMASSDGVSFLDEKARAALLRKLMPLATLVTPNLHELSILSGLPTGTDTEAVSAGERLMAMGARNVLIKGGHRAGLPNDILIKKNDPHRVFSRPRHNTIHTHGTGCLLSSLIAGLLRIGLDLEASIYRAKFLLTTALIFPVQVGSGRGYPDILTSSGMTSYYDKNSRHTVRLKKLRGLYVITDSNLRPDRSTIEIVRSALAGGASVIQLREKSLPTQELILLAKSICAAVHKANALFIVNDRVDVALASDADGVHLGPGDMRASDAREILDAGYLIGVSVNSIEEANEAAPYASYLGVGAIFGSTTKKDAGDAIGLGILKELKSRFPKHPIVAIGGINEGNIREVSEAGADAAAVISAVIAAPDMRSAVQRLIEQFRQTDDLSA